MRASLGVPDVEASDVELQSLWEVGTDALHYQVILRDRFPASVTRFSVGGTAEDLRAIAPWQNPACEPFPDERTQRLLGLHDDSPHSTEYGRLAQMAKPKPEKGRESEPAGTTRVLPMQLQMGDRLTDGTGEWEVVSRPYTTAGGRTPVSAFSGCSSPAAPRSGSGARTSASA